MLFDPAWQPNESRLSPQVVEDCASDVGPGIGAEWTLLTGSEPFHSIDQGQSAYLNEIVEILSGPIGVVQSYVWAERGRDIPQ